VPLENIHLKITINKNNILQGKDEKEKRCFAFRNYGGVYITIY